MSIPMVRIVAELRSIVAAWRRGGLKIAVVPTMGALHEGHLSLVRAALAKADRVIVTLFVNPKQFNNADDLDAYPRTEFDDAAKLAPLGAHILYAPDAADIYPQGFATTVSMDGVSGGLCGAFRPGHFDGVATVVTKLFLQTGADLAFFGEKDFQQLQVVRRLVRDLDIPIEIIACATVREADGLAMSSRNTRLSAAERRSAPKLAEILFETAGRLSSGASVERTLNEARQAILAAGFSQVEYLELRADNDLASIAYVESDGAATRRRLARPDAADRQCRGEVGATLRSRVEASRCLTRGSEEPDLGLRIANGRARGIASTRQAGCGHSVELY